MPPDPDPYQVWHSSQAEAGSNYIGFDNAEADEIIEKARESFDRQERSRLYHRFHEIVHEEQPYTFLLAPKSLLAVDKRVHGVRVYPFGVQEKEWFIPVDLRRYGK
jgi:peptide/nickel transport system substrate-binding protein